jgi:hypothetical protein
MKNVSNPLIETPNNIGAVLAGSGYKLDKNPAIKLEAAADRNQTPIKSDMNRAGDSFVTADNPMGDIQSSPKVIIT